MIKEQINIYSMNFLRKKLNDLKRPFGKGQKWEKYAPAINAFDTFLFVLTILPIPVHTFGMRLISKEQW